MRYLLLFLAISILNLQKTNAQTKELHVTIKRDKPDGYYIVSKEGDSTLVSLGVSKENRFTSNYSFHLLPGEGRAKDEKGTREKNKKYLLTKSRDTILTVRKKSNKIEFADHTYITKHEIKDGWHFIDVEGTIVYGVNLIRNKTQWIYTIKLYDDNENIVALNKYVTMSLYDMAKNKNFENSHDDDNDILWFAMMLTANTLCY